jgi:hypothetical protein
MAVVIFISFAGVGLCFGPLSAPAIAEAMIAPVSTSGSTGQMDPLLYTSSNWGGYAAETNFSNPQSNTVTSVSGSWIVPTVTPSANSSQWPLSDCAVWVGIDGLDNSTVEQVGTESYVYNGEILYDAWYQMYPASSFITFGVSPGDSITASVTYSPPRYSKQFQLSLTDNTNGKSFTVYTSSSTALRTSAEWIAKAPSAFGGIVPLPTFGSVSFTNAQATIGSITGAIDDPSWQVEQINMSNPTWGDAMNPSALSDSGSGSSATSSFTVVQAPEPTSLSLLILGGLAMRRRNRKT